MVLVPTCFCETRVIAGAALRELSKRNNDSVNQGWAEVKIE
jgi:hypothetical protein